jgi:hypothetical protein
MGPRNKGETRALALLGTPGTAEHFEVNRSTVADQCNPQIQRRAAFARIPSHCRVARAGASIPLLTPGLQCAAHGMGTLCIPHQNSTSGLWTPPRCTRDPCNWGVLTHAPHLWATPLVPTPLSPVPAPLTPLPSTPRPQARPRPSRAPRRRLQRRRKSTSRRCPSARRSGCWPRGRRA